MELYKSIPQKTVMVLYKSIPNLWSWVYTRAALNKLTCYCTRVALNIRSCTRVALSIPVMVLYKSRSKQMVMVFYKTSNKQAVIMHYITHKYNSKQMVIVLHKNSAVNRWSLYRTSVAYSAWWRKQISTTCSHNSYTGRDYQEHGLALWFIIAAYWADRQYVGQSQTGNSPYAAVAVGDEGEGVIQQGMNPRLDLLQGLAWL